MKLFVWIFLFMLMPSVILAQESAEVTPDETVISENTNDAVEEMVGVSSPQEQTVTILRNYKEEMQTLFNTYTQEKQVLDNEYGGRINALNPSLSDMQGMLEKQNLIEEYEDKKKNLLNAYRENNNRLKLEEKASRVRPGQEEELYEEEETAPVLPKPAVKKTADDPKKRNIKPYEETSGYKKKPIKAKANDKKKTSYVSKVKAAPHSNTKPKKKLISGNASGLLDKNKK